MKGIKTTNITTGVRMPFGKRSLDYLQSSYKDTIAELCRAVGIADTATVLHGCDVTVDGDNYTYSSGAICYNGEVYKVEAGALTVESAHTAVWVIVTEFPSSLNPVLFSDGNLRDIHYENKMILQSGISGSGVADWNEVEGVWRKVGDPGAINWASNMIELPLSSLYYRKLGDKVEWRGRFQMGIASAGWEDIIVIPLNSPLRPHPSYDNITSTHFELQTGSNADTVLFSLRTIDFVPSHYGLRANRSINEPYVCPVNFYYYV